MADRSLRGMSIGARFLEIRKAKGLNQVDVAAAIGVSHGALVNYEKGRDPPASAIIAFGKAYGVSPTWLLLGEGRPDHAVPHVDLGIFDRRCSGCEYGLYEAVGDDDIGLDEAFGDGRLKAGQRYGGNGGVAQHEAGGVGW